MKQCSFHHRRLSFIFCFMIVVPLFMLMGCNSLPGAHSETRTPDVSAVFSQQTQVAIIVAKQLTAMPTATLIPTLRPTKTPTITPTPIVGVFSNPYPIGGEAIQKDFPDKITKGITDGLGEMSCKLLEVKTGEDANRLAKTTLDWLTYKQPIQDQEYLAARVHLKRLWYKDNTKVDTLYPGWSLTLRYTEGGEDTWSVDPVEIIAEGYPPIEGESWVFFLIRSGTKPYLYFQPDLMVMEGVGYRKLGTYFSLY